MNTSTSLPLNNTSITTNYFIKKEEESIKLEPDVIKLESGVKSESEPSIKQEKYDKKRKHNKRIQLTSSDAMSHLSGAVNSSSSTTSSSLTNFSSSSSSSYPQVTSALVLTGIVKQNQNQSSSSSSRTHAASPYINRGTQRNSNIKSTNVFENANYLEYINSMEPYSSLSDRSLTGIPKDVENKLLNLFSPDDPGTTKLPNKPLYYINLLLRLNYRPEDAPKRQKLLELQSFFTSNTTENPFNMYCEYFQKIEELGLQGRSNSRCLDFTTLVDAYNISISANNNPQLDLIKLETEHTFLGINNMIFDILTRNLRKPQSQLSIFIKLLEIYKYNFVDKRSPDFELMCHFDRHVVQLTKEKKYDELYALLIQTFKSGLHSQTRNDTPNEVIFTFFNAGRLDLGEKALELEALFLNRGVEKNSHDILEIAEMLAACDKWQEVERIFSSSEFKVDTNRNESNYNKFETNYDRYLQLIIPSYTIQGKFKEAKKLLRQFKATDLSTTLLLFVWIHEKKFSKAQNLIQTNLKSEQDKYNKEIFEFLEAIVSVHLNQSKIESFKKLSPILITIFRRNAMNDQVIIQLFRTIIIDLIEENHFQIVEKEISEIIITESHLSRPYAKTLIKILTETIEKRVMRSLQTSVASTSSSSSSLHIG